LSSPANARKIIRQRSATWATLEDHTVGFRGSPAFTQWRAQVGPFFATLPVVEHFAPMTGEEG
jgi:hypothetical protein